MHPDDQDKFVKAMDRDFLEKELDVLSFANDREIAERALVVKACKEG
ncbi:MAG: hypothetical protein GX085_02030 [Firmicutes bacterium]|nr:hypothetical protein [Bacillota bacterium]